MKENCAPDVSDVVSTCDCTGLIPSLPSSDMQVESYADITPIPECEVKNENI